MSEHPAHYTKGGSHATLEKPDQHSRPDAKSSPPTILSAISYLLCCIATLVPELCAPLLGFGPVRGNRC